MSSEALMSDSITFFKRYVTDEKNWISLIYLIRYLFGLHMTGGYLVCKKIITQHFRVPGQTWSKSRKKIGS